MDYINKSPHKNRAINTKSIREKVFVAIALLILSFAVGRQFLIESSSESNKIEQQNIGDNIPVFIAPELPSEEFVYPEILSGANDIAELPQYHVPEDKEHRLRCGSFLQRVRAQKLVDKIKQTSSMNIIVSGKWFVVTSAWLNDKRAAQNLSNKVKKVTGIYTCKIHSEK